MRTEAARTAGLGMLAICARNPNLGDLFADYPRLTTADVQACFAYAHALVKREGKRTPSLRRDGVRLVV